MKEFSSMIIEEPRQFLLPQNPFFDIVNDESPVGESHHDDTFSDLTLTYISQMLMDEDDKIDNFHEYAALQATEKPFYDILAQNYLPSSSNSYSPDSDSPNSGISSGGASNGVVDGIWLNDFPEYQLPLLYPKPPNSGISSQSSFGSVGSDSHGWWVKPEDYQESDPASQFRRGEEEARKFLPSENRPVIDLEYLVKTEKDEYESRGKKKSPHDEEDLDLQEGRSVKHSAVSFADDTSLRSPDFDDALLCNGCNFPKAVIEIRDAYQIGPNRSSSKHSSKGKGRGKKQSNKEVVDLTTLLTQCAQMVAADDRRGCSEILKQIRQHSSSTGDGSQRVAHYIANGLEARLAGTGSDIYKSIQQKRRTAADYLKAFQLYLAVCPIKKISYAFSNQQIMDVSKNATRIHVVDFGISFGFQWPCLIQRLSQRPNGPPHLRITGIDLPQPGFRPRERLDETGRRLAEYAKDFGVPFEYNGISSRWEDVRVEDVNLREDEVLAVNCMFTFRYLADETVSGVDCPRNTVLTTIRKMKPDIFTHGIANGSYSAPFFVTRFREAMYFYSAIFDMLDENVPREDEQRQLSEREMFGRELVNIIACEGSERVERPETYKQWQARNLRAGFVQLPLDREMVKRAKDKVRDCYHKDFLVDEDRKWLVQGWKGRVLFALSSWKPSDA